jgi:elongation factor G
VTDPYVGRLAYFRVYSGTITQGNMVNNSTKGKRERIGRLIRMYADRREDITEVLAGDIAAALGFKDTFTGDTLCNNKNIALENITFPEPVISVAIEPKTSADQEKMGEALRKLSEEDPTFRVRSDENTSQTIISGMGELHLEIIVDRLRREFKVEANTGAPQIAYRETITAEAPGEGKLVKQSGGRGQYGHVRLAVRPNEKGKGLTIDNKIVGGEIPKDYHNAVFKGVNESMLNGIIAGYPVIDVHVDVLGGSFHEVDSNENAFTMAAIFAMKDAFKKAKAILLEPIMAVEVSTPDDYQGDVMGDLNRRRGQIQNMESKGKLAVIRANVPLKEMFGYSTAVRTLSSGRASYSMTPSHFEQVPGNIVSEIVSDRGH